MLIAAVVARSCRDTDTSVSGFVYIFIQVRCFRAARVAQLLHVSLGSPEGADGRAATLMGFRL